MNGYKSKHTEAGCSVEFNPADAEVDARRVATETVDACRNEDDLSSTTMKIHATLLIAFCKSLIGKLRLRLRTAFARAPKAELDPEILEVFLAEFDELTEALGVLFPKWQANPRNKAPLQNIRRAFHTLKGSGQIAGAHALGEFCGRIEQLAVRILERDINATPELMLTIEQAIHLLPAYNKSVRESLPPPPEARAISQRALQLLGG